MINGIIHSGQEIVTNGLVLHLDAAQLRSYPTTGTTWTDLSGNGNNGTLTNGPTFNSANGGSIVFDGINDYVNCGTGMAQAGGWTISGLVRSNIVNVDQVIIGRTSDASNSFRQNYNLIISNTNKFTVLTSADSYKRIASTTTMATNTWYYVTGKYTSSTKILSIYVNGNLEANSTALVADPPTIGTQYVTLAAGDGLAVANRLNGRIAHGSIYNVALSDQQVLQNFNAIKSRYGL